MAAVTEFAKDDYGYAKKGEPLVIDHWDTQGRIIRVDFKGDRGNLGTKGVSNRYEFDDQGRIIRTYQEVYLMSGETIVDVDYRYEYIAGRPDEEYTTRKKTRGTPHFTELTYEERMHNAKVRRSYPD